MIFRARHSLRPGLALVLLASACGGAPTSTSSEGKGAGSGTPGSSTSDAATGGGGGGGGTGDAGGAAERPGKAPPGAGKLEPPDLAPPPGDPLPPTPAERVQVPGATFPRSSAPASVGGKSAKHVMVHEKLGHELHALAAQPGVPDWGVAAGDPEAARDDDLLTGWKCTPTEERPCAYGLAFPEPVELRAIRLFGGDGTTRKDHHDRPRIAAVRLHTDAGSIEVEGIGDGDHFRWVRLEEAVKTEHLVVEVTGTHGPEGRLTIAEIEAFGSSGLARGPLQLDPSRTWVSFAGTAWGGKERKQGIRRPFLQTIGVGGEPRRIDHGTAIYGRASDRFALVEWLYGTNCEEHGLTYLIVDKQTRMWFHVGTLGNALGQVRRRTDALGFAVGPGEAKSWGLRHDPDNDEIVRDRPDRLDWSAIDDVLEPRGGDRAYRPVMASGCALASELGPLQEAGLEADAAWQWWRCGVGARSVWLGRGEGCEPQWAVHVLEAGGEKLRSEQSSGDASRPPRIQRGTDGSLFIEVVGRSVSRSGVLWVPAEGTVQDLGDGALAVRTPEICAACNGAF